MLSIALVTRAFADVCDPNDRRLLKPDLVAEAPSKVRLRTLGGQHQLMFTATIDNVGDGPLIVTGESVDGPNGSGTQVTQEIRRSNGTTCTHPVGFFPFTSEDEGFHIDRFAEYQLRRDDPVTGPIIARYNKTAFCLLNVVQLRGAQRPADFFDCDGGPQGISVGFGNEEDGLAPGQSINLDDPAIPAGEYFLVIVVNPDGRILEKSGNTSTDAGVASVAIGGRSHIPRGPRPRPTRRPVHGTPSPVPTPTATLAPVAPTATPTSSRPVHPTRPPISLPPGHEGCGGNKGKICSTGEFCQFAENRCGLAQDVGICTPMNQVCAPQVAPVCGCDGVTYQNDCQRQRAGVSAAHHGPC